MSRLPSRNQKKGIHMNIIRNSMLALVAAGSMATICAESITFGVEIPPVASLVVRDGIIRVPKALQGDITPADASLTKVVGGFTLNTNMPKWNIYFTMANNGNLVSQSGNYLTADAATPYYVPLGQPATTLVTGNPPPAGRVWLRFPPVDRINGADAETGTNLIVATSVLQTLITDGDIDGTQNSLTAVLAGSAATHCTAACVDNGWVYGNDATTASFEIGTVIDDAETIIGLAGTYTETLYITLVTAY